MKLSMVLSIHNRGELFARALLSYAWQTLPANEWEVVLVDDASTEDLSEAYKPFIGKINLRHVRFDHRRHHVWAERNRGYRPGEPEDWFHTPALTTNAGVHLARGTHIGLCHPEVIHHPENFERAFRAFDQYHQYIFGQTHLGTQQTNRVLSGHPDWTRSLGWTGLMKTAHNTGATKFGPTELYWYTSFLPKEAVVAVGGVDFIYLNGVAAEDDDFRERVHRAGYPPILHPDIIGLHQDHSHEQEAHRVRNSPRWEQGLRHNRGVYFARQRAGKFPQPANEKVDWTAQECIVEVREFACERI